MANAKTEHSKQLRAKTASRINSEKLASGEYKQVKFILKRDEYELLKSYQEKTKKSYREVFLDGIQDL